MKGYFLCILLSLCLLFQGGFAKESRENFTFEKSQAPLDVNLYFFEPPGLNNTGYLNLEIHAHKDAYNTKIKLILPNEIELISDSGEWVEDIFEGEDKKYQFAVVPRSEGIWKIRADVVSYQDGFTFGRSAEIFLKVGKSNSDILTLQEVIPATSQCAAFLESEFSEPPPPSMRSPELKKGNQPNINYDTLVGPGEIVVSGYWKYQDKNGISRAYRDARVEIWDSDLFGDDLLVTVYTDNSGYYETPAISNSDGEGGGQEIYVKVFSTDDFSVIVTNFSSSNAYWAQTSALSNVPDGYVDVGTWVISDQNNRQACYIYDKIANEAFDYLYLNANWVNSYNLQVRWAPDNTTDGTHYHPGGTVDLVAGDGWDIDVFLHEYGHFVMYKIYGNSMPSMPSCNPHYWGSHSSLGCAWGEGWANFLQAAIQNNRYYDDTDDQTLHYDYEPPNPDAHHPEDEGAVAASLWDIYDSLSESWDSISLGINGSSSNGIWRIVANDNPVDVLGFYDFWESSSNGNDAQVASILEHHLISVCAVQVAPTGVSASDGTYTDRVYITWNSASGASSYQVYRNTSSSTSGATAISSWQSGTSFNDYNVNPGVTYYYWVKAQNSCGNVSGFSSYNTGYVSCPSQAAPTGVNASDGTYTDRVYITWNSASGASSYQVYRNTSSSTSGATAISSWQSGTSFNDYNVSSGITYYYWVKAQNSCGNVSGFSSYNTGYVSCPSQAAPTGVNASDGTYTDRVYITWNSASGASSYQVYRNTSSSTSGATAISSWQSGTSFNDYNVSSGITYYYWVKAQNSCGNVSGFSSYNTGYVSAPCPSQTAPTGVNASDGTYSDRVYITWNSASGASSYQVYRNTSSSTSGAVAISSWQGGTSYNDYSVTPGTTYYYWVKAKNSCGNESGYSSYDTGYAQVSVASSLLWTQDGSAHLWNFDASGGWAGAIGYGNTSGWTTTSYQRNSDGSSQLLWTRDGSAHLWKFNASGDWVGAIGYGYTSGWTATCYQRNTDGSAQLLWTRDGSAHLWKFNASGGWVGATGYGYSSGWTATCYQRNSDGSAQLLWTRDGSAHLWKFNASGGWVGATGYGYSSGWTATCYQRNGDGSAQLLWTSNGSAHLWKFNSSGGWAGATGFGYTGWRATSYQNSTGSLTAALQTSSIMLNSPTNLSNTSYLNRISRSDSLKETPATIMNYADIPGVFSRNVFKYPGDTVNEVNFAQQNKEDFEIYNKLEVPYIIIKKAGNGGGTVTAKGLRCDKKCMELIIPYDKNTIGTVQVLPNAGSSFVRFETSPGVPLENIQDAQPGEVVIAVFDIK
jgi:hypothetical protein